MVQALRGRSPLAVLAVRCLALRPAAVEKRGVWDHKPRVLAEMDDRTVFMASSRLVSARLCDTWRTKSGFLRLARQAPPTISCDVDGELKLRMWHMARSAVFTRDGLMRASSGMVPSMQVASSRACGLLRLTCPHTFRCTLSRTSGSAARLRADEGV
jgi:hypothetical protein